MSQRARRFAARSGAALLEAIVALTVLAIAGISLLGVASDAYRVIERSADSERRMRDANRLLDAASLWSRTELDQRLGERIQGSMRMRIVRLSAKLYRVQLLTAADDELLLATSLHRGRSADAP